MLLESNQIIVVVSADWGAVEGSLYCYQREQLWNLVLGPIPVSLGKHGMAYGRGIQNFSDPRDNRKKEGDGRSPAGAFLLGPVFGNALHACCARNMDFLLIQEGLECIDDSQSIHYNKFVSSEMVQNKDWKSSEKMDEITLYDLGICIQHNSNPVMAGMGSAIFFHRWRSEGAATEGCTAMRKDDLEALVNWLNQADYPCLVQLPIREYLKQKFIWDLPILHDFCG
ncbi:MAG: L,D-transpeptidase family protein [Candidatus Protochlamydia sp.]|nr:L,D-transpeptidase family protein [Candidatus Protochlamydia sp.]